MSIIGDAIIAEPRDSDVTSLMQRVDATVESLHMDRSEWDTVWDDISRNMAPYAARGLNRRKQDEANDGKVKTNAIMDPHAQYARRDAAAGLMSGMTNPATLWFGLSTGDPRLDDSDNIRGWLDLGRRKILSAMASTSFYQGAEHIYDQALTFGTGVATTQEDFDEFLLLRNVPIGQYWIDNGRNGLIDRFYRNVWWTADMVVANAMDPSRLPQSVRNAHDRRDLKSKFEVVQAIEPNDGDVLLQDTIGPNGQRMPYRSILYLKGNGRDPSSVLGVGFFFEFPVFVARWSVLGEDSWGRGAGHDALPDVKQLQKEAEDWNDAREKLVRPPLRASGSVDPWAVNTDPDGMTFDDNRENGVTPLYQVNYRPEAGAQGMADLRQRIDQAFYRDKFLLMTLTDKNLTATEVNARQAEKLAVLAPVAGRLSREFLGPAIRRYWNTLNRMGQLPPPPAELAGFPDLEINFLSPLAQAQRALEGTPLRDYLNVASAVAAIEPRSVRKTNWDAYLEKYATVNGVDPSIQHSDDTIEEMDHIEAQAIQQQEALNQAQQVAQTGKTAGEIDPTNPIVESMISGGAL